MKVQVSFPKCRVCRNEAPKSFHKDCPNGGGVPLEIDPQSKIIYCSKCGNNWRIYDSTYYCSCGSIFTAKQVSDEVEYVIKLSKLVADEIRYMRVLENQRKYLVEDSLSNFTINFLNKMGVAFGYVSGILENIVKTVKSLLFFIK